MPFTIGLTGGIGSGKSTVARILERLGAAVIDADRIGHEVYEPGTECLRRVVEEFGPEILSADGTVDRKKLGAIVFADPERLRRLNAIVHPRIAAAIAERIQRHRETQPQTPLVLEAALLVEAGWSEVIDETWVVVASPATVRSRLVENRAMTPGEIDARVRAQISNEKRRARADVVIENDGTRDDLERRVRELWAERVEISGDATQKAEVRRQKSE